MKLNADTVVNTGLAVLAAMILFKFLDVLFLNDWAMKAKKELDEK